MAAGGTHGKFTQARRASGLSRLGREHRRDWTRTRHLNTFVSSGLYVLGTLVFDKDLVTYSLPTLTGLVWWGVGHSYMVPFPKVDFCGFSSANGMIWFSTICCGLLRTHVKSFGMPDKIMVGLSGNGR